MVYGLMVESATEYTANELRLTNISLARQDIR